MRNYGDQPIFPTFEQYGHSSFKVIRKRWWERHEKLTAWSSIPSKHNDVIWSLYNLCYLPCVFSLHRFNAISNLALISWKTLNRAMRANEICTKRKGFLREWNLPLKQLDCFPTINYWPVNLYFNVYQLYFMGSFMHTALLVFPTQKTKQMSSHDTVLYSEISEN